MGTTEVNRDLGPNPAKQRETKTDENIRNVKNKEIKKKTVKRDTDRRISREKRRDRRVFLVEIQELYEEI